MSDSAKPSVLEFKFLLAIGRGIAGELQDLATVTDPIGIALVPVGPASICLLYLVSLSPMHVPRFVTRRDLREILVLVDRPTLSR